jgi:hypothetical protein
MVHSGGGTAPSAYAASTPAIATLRPVVLVVDERPDATGPGYDSR